MAIVGRPNVGKSTLFNRLIGEERAMVHDMPGTTRDAIDTVVETSRRAGAASSTRRACADRQDRAGHGDHAVLRALEALDRADVAMLVIDATVGATHQDQRLAERIGVSGCPAVVVLNKWDLVGTEERPTCWLAWATSWRSSVTPRSSRRPRPRARASTASCRRCATAAAEYVQRIPTGELNRAVRDLQAFQPSPPGKIRYAVQGAIEPPTFTLFVSGRLSATYLRYVERGCASASTWATRRCTGADRRAVGRGRRLVRGLRPSGRGRGSGRGR